MTRSLLELLQGVVEKVKGRGYSEEKILQAAAAHRDALADRFADFVTQAASKSEAYSVVVNYQVPVEDAILAGDYQAVNASITAANFPSRRSGIAQMDILLIHFDRRMISEEILQELDKAGLRPVELLELLAFGAAFPEVQRKFVIVGLGSIWTDRRGYRNVPCLYEASEGRYLDLHWWDDGWYSSSRIAVVRQ
jgi:hypothetical protein